VTRLVDTTIRLLSQDPLAGHLSTARLLNVAERLDGLGYAGLEVSGGGCFKSAVERAVESPWERIRAIKARAPKTPLVMALRGTFLVGMKPAHPELVRRFILVAAESGIDVFRLNDPLNDVDDLEGPADAVREAGAQLHAGLVYSDAGGVQSLVERAGRLAAFGAERVLLHDPAGALDPAAAGELIGRMRDAARIPVGLYTQGAGGTSLAVAIEAARAGADPIATASYPIAMLTHRVPAELLAQALGGLELDHGLDRQAAWDVARVIEADIGEAAGSQPQVSPNVALRAALNTVPAGLVAGIERRLQAVGAGDRVDEVLDELHRVRADAGSPPPASPVGRILASQAIQHVLTARRWEMVDEEMRRLLVGEYGHPPAPVDPAARAVAERTVAQTEPQTSLEDAKAEAGSLAASEEDLCLVALFGESAFPLLSTLRGRSMPTGDEAAAVDDSEGERIRRLMRILDESGLHEITVDDGGVRYTLKKPEPAPPVQYVATAPVAVATNGPTPPAEAAPPAEDLILIESPMVATFYRAPSPSQPAFVEEGDRVEVGQTLCVLEAMKLFNELKAEHAGTVRKILVGNAEPVEFGQTLFEISPA